MRPQPVGYEFLRTHLATGAFEPNRVAVVAPVTKVVASGDRLQVPAQVAPSTDDPLAHLLFALKHEGLDLQAAILALKHIPASPVATAFAHSPGSAYLRQIGYLWELAHGQQLPDTPAVLPANEGRLYCMPPPASALVLSMARSMFAKKLELV